MYECPACSFPGLQDLPRSEASGAGSYEICPSGGFEIGVTDDDKGYTYKTWEAEWAWMGRPWSSSAIEPLETWESG